METWMREEMELALEDKREGTRVYFRNYVALLEEYITRMNANKYDPQAVTALREELEAKARARYDDYIEECITRGLLPEVGWVINPQSQPSMEE